MLQGLNHLTLAVTNLDVSFAFYAQLPGFRPRARWRSGAYFSCGELWLCLSVDPLRGKSAPDYTHYAFSVAPQAFTRVVRQLRAAEVREWKDNHSEGDSLYFLDPDGHRLEIHSGDLASRLTACREHPYQDMVFFD